MRESGTRGTRSINPNDDPDKLTHITCNDVRTLELQCGCKSKNITVLLNKQWMKMHPVHGKTSDLIFHYFHVKKGFTSNSLQNLKFQNLNF